MAGNDDITFNLTFDDVFSDRELASAGVIMTRSHSEINTYATIADFESAQDKGITYGSKIPNNSVNFNITGTNFATALKEINNGQKQTHWMWYILPSDLDTKTETATFFKLGPQSVNSLTEQIYLNNSKLHDNYVKMIRAINKYLEELSKISKKHKINYNDELKKMFIEDYANGNLQRSISIFTDAFILYSKLQNIQDSLFVPIIKKLDKILNPTKYITTP